MRIYFETYGCALNKADTALMKTLLIEAGHEIVDSVKEADAVIINTCTVRLDTEQRMIKRLKELRNFAEGKRIIVAGCMVSAQPYTVAKIIPEASLITPQTITRVVEAVEAPHRVFFLEGDRDMSYLKPYVDGPAAAIPIAEGCLGECSFCITKIARRRLRSYRPGLIARAVSEAVGKGAVEIDLTAQDTASYGIDLGSSYRLPQLVEEILDSVNGDYFLRIGMMNPDTLEGILDELIEVMKHPKVFKYVHLPLQSGSDKVLKIMRRKYSYDDYRELVKELRRKIPEVSIATDIIVGHPGEDWEDFLLTVEGVKELLFDKVHLAQYTIRPRTEAAAMRQVPDPEKKRRSTLLLKVVEEVGQRINSGYVGTMAEVIASSVSIRGSVIGRTFNYKPVVILNVSKNVLRKKVLVRVTEASFYDLRGVMEEVTS